MSCTKPRIVGLIACVACGLGAVVLAGDINPPPGPIGDSGPDLRDILLAVGGGGSPSGESLTPIVFGQPPSGAFSTIATSDGVVDRVVLTNIGTTSIIVHLRDADGVVAQLNKPSGLGTTSIEVGAAFVAPLEIAVIGQTTSTSISVIVRTAD